uniref:sn-1-specific diacylglycerol lipase n=1 Tax=Tetraselmis sp. GSL018 TaxID=582737 RepID=A0A061QLA9_9CHLO
MSPEARTGGAADSGDVLQAEHFLKFAMAAYGPLMYMYSARWGCCGKALSLGSKAARREMRRWLRVQKAAGSQQDAGALGREAIFEFSGIPEEDLIHVSKINQRRGSLPYFVALDRASGSAVLSIRGTMSVADCLTDAQMDPTPVGEWLAGVPPGDVKGGGGGGEEPHAHSGMLRAARAVLADLYENQVLDGLLRPPDVSFSGPEAPREHGASLRHGPSGTEARQRGQGPQGEPRGPMPSGWGLVVTGHSLGAGVAALVGLKLRERFPLLRIWVYAAPGCLISRSVAESMSSFCTNVVLGQDWVPRANLLNAHSLRDSIMMASTHCRLPKLVVMYGSLMRCLPRRLREEQLFHETDRLPPEPAEVWRSYCRREGGCTASPVMAPALNFVSPGRTLFLRPLEHQTRANRGKYEAVWLSVGALQAEGLLISRRCLADHFPGSILQALSALAKDGSAETLSQGLDMPNMAEKRGSNC